MNNSIAPSRWYRLIPVAFITYSLAYLDRANYGFAAAGEMKKDLFLVISFFKFRERTMLPIKVRKNLSSGH